MSACSAALVATAFNWFSCPLFPRPPSPAGKGEIYSYLMQGAPPLASPGLEPERHWGQGRTTCPVGDVLSLSPVATAFNWFSCPLSPARARRALFPGGEGGIYSYLMQGASPLASPGGLNPRGTGGGASHVLGGRCAFLVAGFHCLPLAFLPPIPPTPFPQRGRGDL